MSYRAPPRRASRTQRYLLLFAWMVFLVSAGAPAFESNIVSAFLFCLPLGRYNLDYTPAGMAALEWLLVPRFWENPYSLIAPALLAFLWSPVLIRPSWTRGGAVTRRVFGSLLLMVWLVPCVRAWFMNSQQRHYWFCDHLMWGYYLFAASLTIAFIAVQLAPWPERRNWRRGFDVVLNDRRDRWNQKR